MNKIKIPTYGYKIVILDFDSSMIKVNKDIAIEFYWSNLENMLSRVNTELKTKNGDIINMVELAKDILSFIGQQKLVKGNYFESVKLINMINNSTLRIIKNPLKGTQVPFEPPWKGTQVPFEPPYQGLKPLELP